MITLGDNCPDFRIDMRGGVAGPPSLRGRWYALIHCDRPCMPGCEDCIAKFSALALALRQYQCRLVVALDTPEGTMLLRPARCAESQWVLAHWRGPRTSGDGPIASALIVDPDGKVRATLEVPDSESQNVVLLLDLVRRVQDDPRLVHVAVPDRTRESAGCVDWFDFGSPPLH